MRASIPVGDQGLEALDPGAHAVVIGPVGAEECCAGVGERPGGVTHVMRGFGQHAAYGAADQEELPGIRGPVAAVEHDVLGLGDVTEDLGKGRCG
jgi:hypothetical protein